MTLELHVRRDLDDKEVLELTRWAHDRCRVALSPGASASRGGRDGGGGESEVTVGIVRG